MLHTAAARVAALDLGFVPGQGGMDVAGIVEGRSRAISMSSICLVPTKSTRAARQGFCRLPGYAWRPRRASGRRHSAGGRLHRKERDLCQHGGRAQMTARAVFPPGEAKEDWAIIRALSAAVGKTLPFDTLADLRKAMLQYLPASRSHRPDRAGRRRRTRCDRPGRRQRDGHGVRPGDWRLLPDQPDRARLRRDGGTSAMRGMRAAAEDAEGGGRDGRVAQSAAAQCRRLHAAWPLATVARR